MRLNVRNQSSVIRMKPVLLLPGPSSATFLIPSSLRCLQELLGCRCQRSPSMCLGGGKLPCTPLHSMCTMSCEWGISHHLWSGAACSIPPKQGSPLLGALRSSHFPCLMTFRRLPWLHPPSGLCGPCSLFMLRALVLLSRIYLALGRRYPVVANPQAGWPPVIVKPLRSWSSGLQPML